MKQLFFVLCAALLFGSCAPQMTPTTSNTGNTGGYNAGTSASTSNSVSSQPVNNDPQNQLKATGQAPDMKNTAPAK